nr:hypothetical protein BaRGS_023193 [Batillaria attramentaria]
MLTQVLQDSQLPPPVMSGRQFQQFDHFDLALLIPFAVDEEEDGGGGGSYLEQGLVAMTYGSRDSLVDFLHVDNLVQGHILAARGLSPDKQFVAAGQSYFLSDSKPINNFEFFRPLIEGLGYTYPKINLPVNLIFYFDWMIAHV